MFTFAATQSPIKKLWRDGLAFYAASFAKMWYLILVLAVISVVMQYCSSLIPIDNLSKVKIVFNLPVVLWIITVIISLLVQIYCVAVIYHRLYNLGNNRLISLNVSLQKIQKRYSSVLVLSLLVMIVVLLGIVALVIPGIFLAIALMFSLPSLICDEMTVKQAITASFKLSWGNWWRSFAVMIPSLILIALVSSIMSCFNLNSLRMQLLDTLLFTLISSLWYPFILVQFNDLRLRKR